jgi:hypothetical protein
MVVMMLAAPGLGRTWAVRMARGMTRVRRVLGVRRMRLLAFLHGRRGVTNFFG